MAARWFVGKSDRLGAPWLALSPQTKAASARIGMGTLMHGGTACRRGQPSTYHASHLSFLVGGCNDFLILVRFLEGQFSTRDRNRNWFRCCKKHMPLRGCVTGESYRSITNWYQGQWHTHILTLLIVLGDGCGKWSDR